MGKNCPFCTVKGDAIVLRNDLCYAIFDKYPVTEGHMLVIPFRHVADYFSLTREEKNALWELVEEVKKFLDRKFKPDGYNIGINIGKAAGQTIMHVHVHVIPRYWGDCEDPKGGIRGVIPGRQKY